MSKDENQFEPVRRLLALKRHEVPPPGYFHDFSAGVLQGIREGRATGSLAERFFEQLPWLERIFRMLDSKPVFASGFVGAMCLLLFLAVANNERPEAVAPQLLPSASANAASFATLSPVAIASATTGEQPGIVSSTNPVLSLQAVAAGSAFGQPNPLAQPVSITLPGH